MPGMPEMMMDDPMPMFSEQRDDEAMMGAMMEHYQGVNPYEDGAHGAQPPPGERPWNGGPAAGAGEAPQMMRGMPGGDSGQKQMMRQMLYERLRKMGANSEQMQNRR